MKVAKKSDNVRESKKSNTHTYFHDDVGGRMEVENTQQTSTNAGVAQGMVQCLVTSRLIKGYRDFEPFR